MKKFGLFAGILVTSLCLTGCGNKTDKLVCTLEKDQSGVGNMEATATTYFGKDGNATKAELNMVFTAESETVAKTLYNTMKSSYDDIEVKGTKVTIKEKFETTSDEEKIDKKEARKTYEEQGYTCK